MSVKQRLNKWLGEYVRWDICRRLLPYVRPHWPTMVVVLVIEIAYTGFGLVDPWFMKVLVDNGIGGQPLPLWLRRMVPMIEGGGGSVIVFVVLSGLLFKLTQRLVEWFNGYLKDRINRGISVSFSVDMFHHLQRLSFSYHDRTTVADSLYRVNNDTGFVSTMLWSNPRHLLTGILSLTGILLIVTRLDWQVAALAVAIAPIQYFTISFYSRLFKTRSNHVRSLESSAQTVLQETLSCLRVVKAFGQEEREQQRFNEHCWVAVRARMRLEAHRELFSQSLSLVSRLDRYAILLLTAFHALHGRITVGELLVIMNYVGQVHDPIEGIGDALTNMQSTLISAERALEVLDVEPEVRDRPDARALDHVEGAITLEDVSFSYVASRPVVQHVNFTVQPGEVVAIVGPTGAGKSTLASLIIRFYDPESGRVLLDGHDVRDLTVRTLRDNIALVLQEPVLFSGTIRDNIAYGRPDAPIEEIEAAARAANAHDFIVALESGYDTQAGERGARLSGGERQRIAMARAFLIDAPILVLDEPTSSVDSRTEEVIIDALERLMVGRTTFIIAHRLSTIRAADKILVMDRGRLVESGSHGELLDQGGTYAQLHRIQTSALQRRGRTRPVARIAREVAHPQSASDPEGS